MSVLAFDTETCGLDWFNADERAFLVTWADADGAHWADLSDRESAEVGRFIEAVHAADIIVGHNLPFDTHQIRETLGIDITRLGKELHDTDLKSRVLHPEGQAKRGSHGLKNLATVYLRVDAKDPEDAIKEMGKAIGLRTIKQKGAYFRVYQAYPNEMVEYALADADYTRQIDGIFNDQLAADPKAAGIYELERQVMPILIEAERIGIRTDQAAVAKFKRQFTEARDECHTRLVHELGEKALTPKKDWDDGWDADDDTTLAEALQKVGVPLTELTKTGKISTSRFALGRFEADHPVVADLFEYRRYVRFLNTYIGPMDGREVIHPSFHQCGAWTGRMSCSRPNMQNWPQRAGKEVRSVLVPREGYSFVVCDYDQIETRLLAYYLGDRDFRKLIDDGYDAHAWVAAQIWPEVGDYDYFCKGAPGEEGEQSRKTARHTEFAIVYGAGAYRINSMNPWMDPGPYWDENHPAIRIARAEGRAWPKIGYQYHEARDLIRKIKSSLPGYTALQQRVTRKIKRDGYVSTIMGRKNPVNPDKAYVGINALIQGSAADIMKQGLVNVNAAVSGLGGVPVLVVHDEVVVEVPTENAAECLDLTKAAMLTAYDLSPRLGVSGSGTDKSYADC